MWELDYKESWGLKNWYFWTVVLEKTLESPLDCKEIQLVHPKGDQSWVFIGRNDAEYETPILCPPDGKSWLIWKNPDAEKDWRQEEKGTTEDEVVGWHHRLNGHGFGWTLGVDDGQGGLACCSSWGRKESDTTEWLNWTEPRNTATLLELSYHLKYWTLPVLKVAVFLMTFCLSLDDSFLGGRDCLTLLLPCSFPMDKMNNESWKFWWVNESQPMFWVLSFLIA